MLEWIRKKFVALLPVFIVIGIIGDGFALGMVFVATFSDFLYFILGFIIGVLLGILFSIFIFGIIACVISIADTNERIVVAVGEIARKVEKGNESVVRELQTVRQDMMNVSKKNLHQQAAVSTAESKTESSAPAQKPTEKTFKVISVGNKRFAVADEDESLTYYCPKCHARVTGDAFSCNNCNANLVAD